MTEPLYTGPLKVVKGSSSKKMWAAILPTSPVSAPMLKVYGSKNDQAKDKPAKESVPLNQLLSCAPVETKKGVFRLSLPNGDRDFIVESDEIRLQWIEAIRTSGALPTVSFARQSAVNDSGSGSRENALYSSIDTQSWEVKVDQIEAAKALELPKVALCQVTPVNISICDTKTAAVIVSWPLRYLRRYGAGERREFYFEAGRRCPTGPGFFNLTTEHNHEIGETVDRFTKILSSQFSPDGSATSSPARTPSASRSIPSSRQSSLSPLKQSQSPYDNAEANSQTENYYSSPLHAGNQHYMQLNDATRMTERQESQDSVYSRLGSSPHDSVQYNQAVPRSSRQSPNEKVPDLLYDDMPAYGEGVRLRGSMPPGERPYDTALIPGDLSEPPAYADSAVTSGPGGSTFVHYASNEPMYMDERETGSSGPTYSVYAPIPGEGHYDLDPIVHKSPPNGRPSRGGEGNYDLDPVVSRSPPRETAPRVGEGHYDLAPTAHKTMDEEPYDLVPSLDRMNLSRNQPTRSSAEELGYGVVSPLPSNQQFFEQGKGQDI